MCLLELFSFKPLSAAIWVLGTKPVSSGRAVSILNWRGIAQAPRQISCLKKDERVGDTKHLLCKREVLSSDPQPTERSGVLLCTYNK